MMECILCNKDILVEANGWELGNNAEPLVAGRCCDNCNWAYVIPARIHEEEYTHYVDRDNKNEMKTSDAILSQLSKKNLTLTKGRNNMDAKDVNANDVRKIVDDDLLKLPQEMTEEEAKGFDKMFRSVKTLNFANTDWEGEE